MNISEKLKSARKQKKIKQKDLARDLDVVLSTIGDIESGRRSPSKIVALKLAEYFNTPVGYWMDERDLDEINTYFLNRNKFKMVDEVLNTLINNNKITNDDEISKECLELIKDAIKIDLKVIQMKKETTQ